MEEKLASQYTPKGIESELYSLWEKSGYFTVHGGNEGGKNPYIIVIPPPNITGFLHMGHALNNTIQDIVIRQKRMEGYNALWVPGTDHAGIATQNVVEKMLAEKGVKRQELGREKFIEEVWKWKDKYGSRIIFQLKTLGASCDWSRLRFTMDETLSSAVTEAFVHLFDKKLIYRGEKIINWCPRCTTALSDEEVDYQDEEATLYYIRYPFVKGGFITVATTRPETMLGDTAIAVHPQDERYEKFIGEEVKLPFIGRIIKVLPDEYVEPDFGTGAVKVTPSHDPNDFEIGQRHHLTFITVISEEGIMNDNAGIFKGTERFECRQKLIEKLDKQGLLDKKEPHSNRIGRCYRCRTVIEPYLSKQWFIDMKSLAKPAIEAAEAEKLKFYPERWKKVYLQWLYNIKDWCISRQIWWGHRIPVWYCNSCKAGDRGKNGNNFFVSKTKPESCPFCNSSDIYQDSDVLDTWFSSWLWPFSVFGWPEKNRELEIFYPTNSLVTAQEILFFWVARMVMAGYEFMGEAPFKNIFIHGTVRDSTGKKMSKSLGNVIDPVKIIEDYGADSLRFSLISMTALGQDVFLSPTFYIKGRNFTNKIWNASRFIFSCAEKEGAEKISFDGDISGLNFVDRWLLSELDALIGRVENSLNSFRLNEALNSLYDFFWHYFCDWYLEIAKVYGNDEYFKERVLPVLFHAHSTLIKLLHPFIPFITEKIWQAMYEYYNLDAKSIVISRWPESKNFADEPAREKMASIIEIVTSIRDIKTRFKIPVIKPLDCYFEKNFDCLERKILSRLAGIEKIGTLSKKELNASGILVKNLLQGRLGISLEGIIDFTAEIQKLQREAEKLMEILVKIDKKLNNAEFLKKAPEEVISKEKAKKIQLEEKIQNINKDIDFINKS